MTTNKVSYNLSHIGKLYEKLQTICRPWYGTTPTGDEFAEFVADVKTVFPKLEYAPLFLSLMHLAGQMLTRDTWTAEVWRLAGNYDKLNKQLPVPPWLGFQDTESLPIELLLATPDFNTRNGYGHSYTFRVLAGGPAGFKSTVFWSGKFQRFIASKVGFTGMRGRPPYLFKDGTELVGLRLRVEFDPLKSKDGVLAFNGFDCPSGLLKYNRTILKRRIRVLPCPLNYTQAEMPCSSCYMGRDECVAATHPFTWEARLCVSCNKEQWFDPMLNDVMCLDCRRNVLRENKV